MEIEKVNNNHFQGLKKLFEELKSNSVMSIDNPEELAVSMISMQETGRGVCLVLRDGNKIIGFANSVFIKPGVMEIGIGLSSEYRGKGIGRKLLKKLFLATYSSFGGNIRFEVKARKDNVPSIKLLEEFGFRKTGKIGEKIILENDLREIIKRDIVP